MDDIDFDIISSAWKRLISNPDKVAAMKTEAPMFARVDAIRLKNGGDRGHEFIIRFYGFEAASDQIVGIPTIKRLLVNWIKQISDQVRVMNSTSGDLNLLVSKSSRFTESSTTLNLGKLNETEVVPNENSTISVGTPKISGKLTHIVSRQIYDVSR